MSPTAVLSRVLSQIPGTGDLVLRDDSAVRDFVWSGDAAACVAAFVAAPVVGPYNVGSGEATTVRRLAEIALAVAGQSHRSVVCESRAARASQISLDITETSRAVAWQPRVSLDAAIRKILESRHV
jgi:dTDP-L-rhamnose 4-epimerase